MNQYFSKVTADYWCPKNKLQEEAQVTARDMDRILVPESEMEAFSIEIFTRIDQLNKKHHRCNPLKLYKWKPDSNREEDCFMIDYVFHLSMYKVLKTR